MEYKKIPLWNIKNPLWNVKKNSILLCKIWGKN